MWNAVQQLPLAIRATGLVALTLSLVPSGIAAQARPWQHDRACGARLPQSAFALDTAGSVSSPSPGCKHQQCARLHMGGVVCQCLGDSTRTIVVDSIAPGPFRIIEPRAALADSFEVIESDLDADGRPELVLAVLEGISSGMWVPYWTIYVLMPGGVAWRSDTVAVQDYSFSGSWVVVPNERRCNLLRTQWVNGWEPGRRSGLYFQVTWLTFDIGRFVARLDRPVVRRRYLNSFARERGDTAGNDAPLAWLRSPDAMPWLPSR